MAIDPDVIPSNSSAGNKAVTLLPRWALYGVFGFGVLVVIGILKNLFPLIVMGLILFFIWKQSTKV